MADARFRFEFICDRTERKINENILSATFVYLSLLNCKCVMSPCGCWDQYCFSMSVRLSNYTKNCPNLS